MSLSYHGDPAEEAYHRKYREEHREEIRVKQREYYQRTRDRWLSYAEKHRASYNPEKCIAYTKAWKLRHPEKSFAHMLVSNAIREGKILRQACEVCGSERSNAHHDDYSKPLSIRWLCSKHHAQVHYAMRRRQAS